MLARTGLLVLSTLVFLARSGSCQPLILGWDAKPGDYFGFSVAMVPDLSGDGRWDVAVGIPRADGSRGQKNAVVSLEGIPPFPGVARILDLYSCRSIGLVCEL